MHDRPRVVLNISNCVAGGGRQIAVWFAGRLLAERHRLPYDISFLVNEKHAVELDLPRDETLVLSASPMRSASARKQIRQFLSRRRCDLLFSLFGPSGISHPRQIGGVANAFITSLDLGLFRRIYPATWPMQYLRYFLYGRMLARLNALVFETAGERRRFAARHAYPHERTYVVPNSIHEAFGSAGPQPSDKADGIDGPRLLFVTSIQRHKNNHMLPAYVEALRAAGLDRFILALTLSRSDLPTLPETTGRHIEFLGHLSPLELVQQYRKAHLVVQPSSLETYSAVYNEVRFIPRALLASDRPFSRELCGSFAHFFEPLDSGDFARSVIAALSLLPALEAAAWKERHAVLNPEQKFRQLLEIITIELERRQ